MILVVDDTDDLRNAVVRLLQMRGHPAAGANSGAAALEQMRREAPALVLLDDHMPGLSGLDVFKAMQADPALASIPVVMFSAVLDHHRIEEAKRLGVLDWIDKSRGLLPIERWVQTQDPV